jgi:hypothetical protein
VQRIHRPVDGSHVSESISHHRRQESSRFYFKQTAIEGKSNAIENIRFVILNTRISSGTVVRVRIRTSQLLKSSLDLLE